MNHKLASLVKWSCIIYLMVFLPKVMVDKGKHAYISAVTTDSTESTDVTKPINIGLVAHKEIIGASGERSVDKLLKQGFNVRQLIVFDDDKKKRTPSSSDKKGCIDVKTGIPIMFVDNLESLNQETTFKNVDLVIYDGKGSLSSNKQLLQLFPGEKKSGTPPSLVMR